MFGARKVGAEELCKDTSPLGCVAAWDEKAVLHLGGQDPATPLSEFAVCGWVFG